MSLGEARTMLSDDFPASGTRAGIMSGVEKIVTHWEGLGASGEIWLDGSLLTHKMDPEDGDFSFIASPGTRSLLNPDLATEMSSPWGAHLPGPLHAFGVWMYPPGHPLSTGNTSDLDFWRRFWTHDREGNPKGCAVLKVGGGLR
ncbi:hypothetical protein EON81_29300 [bacterium]|nr:MAG: hypothetical protein EON81_29300 [bacterium]